MKWLKRKFKKLWHKVKKKADRKVITPAKLPSKLEMGFVRPHNNYAQGAVNKTKNVSEFGYFALMYRELATPFKWTTRLNIRGQLAKAYGELADMGVNFSIEPHENAYNKRVGGFECLILAGDKTSEIYAQLYLSIMEKHFPNMHNRGLKTVQSGDRGYANLYAARKAGMKVAILSENFFIDNDKDWIEPKALAAVYDELYKLTK